MKKFVRIIVPILLAAFVLVSVIWYLFDYDRDFTRDVLLREARMNDMRGYSSISAWFYKMAYAHSGNDEAVAIELANQYKSDGNYTKAEVTLSNAIKSNPSVELYTALCRTYVEQDKLMDAVSLLAGIPDEKLRAEIEQLRPTAPVSSQTPGFYSQYIDVDLSSSSNMLLYTTNGEYPSIQKDTYTAPIKLGAGETIVYSISIDTNGLVSPVSVLGYTVGGVVEPAIFMDPEVEFAVHDLLGMPRDSMLYTNDMWEITEFTMPSNIWTLEDLAKFPHLKSLTIKNLQLNTLADIASLSELEALDLTGCRFDPNELTVLAKLPELKKLVISDCGISTIANLEQITGLTYLDISNNTIRNLDVISGMNNLQELYMQHNAVTSLEALSGAYTLEKLNVSFNSLNTLAPLATCTRLNWLDASNNMFTSVTGIAALPLLTSLSLNYNQLTDISELGACVQMKELSINNNSITDINCLGSMMNLEVFDFSYNSIGYLPTWSSGSSLRMIQGSHNYVQSLDPLANISTLTYVSMDYNSLFDISVLATCYNLVQVNVYGNSIPDVSALTQHNIIVNYDPTVQ